jgi:hypothetical protein
MSKIEIHKDFSEYPGLRNCNISDFSGEEFYHNLLNKAFKESIDKKEKLIIDLDYTGGYASSFLDEAFGNLVYDFTINYVKNNIEIISTEEPHWIKMIEEKTFVEWEKRRKSKIKPKKTKTHEPWYRLTENGIEHKVW